MDAHLFTQDFSYYQRIIILINSFIVCFVFCKMKIMRSQKLKPDNLAELFALIYCSFRVKSCDQTLVVLCMCVNVI